LVSIGSCLFVFVSASIDNDNSPSRVAAQVVTGIGFLGSGIIIKDNNQIKGINTAETIWCCGAIGCLCDCGLWLTGMCCGMFVAILNYTLRDTLILLESKSDEKTNIRKVYYRRTYSWQQFKTNLLF
jgi:putative Mg2+ transporter-C (MgtC) family protein